MRKFVTAIGAFVLALGAVLLPGMQPGAVAEPPFTLDSIQTPLKPDPEIQTLVKPDTLQAP